MPFQPGHKINAGGNRAKPFRDALKLAIADADGPKALRKIAQALINEASGGNVMAIKEFADRLDGKVPQPVAGDDENPLTLIHRIESILVDPANPSGESIPAATIETD